MTDKELNTILLENRRMREALEFIQFWELPKIPDHNGRLVTLYNLGSNGERDYMRNVALIALNRGKVT